MNENGNRKPRQAKNERRDADKKSLEAVIRVHGPSVRLYVVAPGTSRDRVQLLRKAFADTMKDPEFLADAKKSKLDINPLTGKELQENIGGIFRLEPALVKKLREILNRRCARPNRSASCRRRRKLYSMID